METILLGVLILLIILIALVLVLILKIQKSQNKDSDYEALTQDLNNEFLRFKNDLVLSVGTDLNTLNVDTKDTLHGISKEMHQGLHMSFNKTNESFTEMSKQLVSIHETQANLKSLSEDITQLQSILGDKKSRGTFGEVELYNILKSAYGLNDKAYATQYRLSNGSIADAVIFASNPLEMVAIDSKFPLENYIRMYDETLSKDLQNQASKQFSRDIKKHIDDIKNKYIIKGETADMAYLFVPSEAIFSEIYGKFEELIHYGYEAKVFLVSQTTLMAYITALKAIYLSVEQHEKVDLIQKEYIRLAVEFDRFETRFQSLGNDFKRMNTDFRDLDITAQKIMNRFKDIEKVQLEEEE